MVRLQEMVAMNMEVWDTNNSEKKGGHPVLVEMFFSFGKPIGKWDNHRKSIGKTSESGGLTSGNV